MNQSFFTGAVGAYQHQTRLNVHADNIANVNTYGFKAQRASFASLMYENLNAIEQEQVKSGTGTRIQMTRTNHGQGGSITTGKAQDYMIQGDGFFALADLSTGEITFTRNGSFQVSGLLEPTGNLTEDGEEETQIVYYLTDGEGRFVLNTQGALIQVDDQNAECPVGVFDYRNYDGMLRQDNSQYLPVDKNGNLFLGSGTVVRGMLELSNTDLASEITQVIEAQRAYQVSLKIVQTSDEIETTINNLRG